MEQETSRVHVLTLSCADRPGLVYEVSEFLLRHGCNIVESQQFGDAASGRFFMRVAFRADSSVAAHVLQRDFGPVADRARMQWRMSQADVRPRVLVMVSRFGHCLNDLLYRAASGSLPIEIVAVVSNHPDLAALAVNAGIPFHHVPVTPSTKDDAETQLMGLVDDLRVDLVVLARYMQVLSGELCTQLLGRAINIHHSMLPSFAGARPYAQAKARGVKLVGATAHYVTADLDDGPIIEQEVTRVDHSLTAEQLTAVGRDNECLALSRAVRWHAQNRILLDGNRTVVFS
ncbi:formyltetrahydrofolate deformylase [uncultured Jatrophihabitans sp.]|uniref:formyltetrahydrofolate deformylase n=1 Tax=uncultured Jatrophihabitans sp. TaxID=1610747 RepID=UPI0035CC680C